MGSLTINENNYYLMIIDGWKDEFLSGLPEGSVCSYDESTDEYTPLCSSNNSNDVVKSDETINVGNYYFVSP